MSSPRLLRGRLLFVLGLVSSFISGNDKKFLADQIRLFKHTRWHPQRDDAGEPLSRQNRQTEQLNYVLLVSRQGKVRLAKWFTTLSPKEKSKIVKDVTQLVLSRGAGMCNFLEYEGIYPSSEFCTTVLRQ